MVANTFYLQDLGFFLSTTKGLNFVCYFTIVTIGLVLLLMLYGLYMTIQEIRKSKKEYHNLMSSIKIQNQKHSHLTDKLLTSDFTTSEILNQSVQTFRILLRLLK